MMTAKLRWRRGRYVMLTGLLAVGLLSGAAMGQGQFFSFRGTFPAGGDQFNVHFDLSQSIASGESFRFTTHSSFGGTNLAGQAIPAGGIDSLVELLDATDASRGVNDDYDIVNHGRDSRLGFYGETPMPSGPNVPINPDPLPADTDYRANVRTFGNSGTGAWNLDIAAPINKLAVTGAMPTGTAAIDSLAMGTNDGRTDPAVFANAGPLALTGDLSIGETGHAQFTHHTGAMSVGGTARLGAGGAFTLAGGSLSAATIDHTHGGSFTFTGGTLAVDRFEGTLTQDGGTLAPGGSVGLTKITGDYPINAGTVQAELSGTAGPGGAFSDRIDVAGTATVGGTLALSAINGFAPSIGDSFTLIDAATVTGTFDQITGIPLGVVDSVDAGLAVIYEPDRVLARASLIGDANLDDVVDVIDLGILASSWQAAGTWATADFTGDGLVDIADLTALAGNWQAGAATPAAAFAEAWAAVNAVPEPTALALLGVATLLLPRRPNAKRPSSISP